MTDSKADVSVDEIVAQSLRVDVDEFDDDTTFGSDGLGAESLDLVEMAESIDMNRGVEIPDEALDEIDTVGELKTYVNDNA